MNDSASPAGFKLTYATMFEPPAELHERFEDAASRIREHDPVVDRRADVELLRGTLVAAADPHRVFGTEVLA